MGFAARHQKGAIFQCDTEGFEYKALKDLYKENGEDFIYHLQGLYINKKSEYGDSPVAICDEYFVNLPAHMLDECVEIMKSQEDIDDIKNGKVGFVIDPYEKKVGNKTKTCYGVKWFDMV